MDETRTDTYTACPNDELLALTGQAADLDAKAIVRVLGAHLLEAVMAGVAPFTRPGPSR